MDRSLQKRSSDKGWICLAYRYLLSYSGRWSRKSKGFIAELSTRQVADGSICRPFVLLRLLQTPYRPAVGAGCLESEIPRSLQSDVAGAGSPSTRTLFLSDRRPVVDMSA
jgi:hypothetical protein